MNLISANRLFELMDENQGEPYLFGVDFELNQGIFVADPQNSSDILWRVGPSSNLDQCPAPQLGSHFEAHPMEFEEFSPKFDRVHQALMHGDSFLTNLTIRSKLDTDFTLHEIAARCTSPYMLMVPNGFVCFSPETFVRIDADGTISSNPMKGTIAASVANALQTLLDDPKESAEHNTVVDLIRNDLSIIADHVRVERFRYADVLHTSGGELIQTSSLIKGQLRTEYVNRIGTAISRMLPAGSVSGAPKRSTLGVISQAEQTARGFYCGVFGLYDGHSLDTAVMIRFIEQDSDGNKHFRSGSGITASSDSRAEYNEMIEKIYLPFQLK